MAEPSHTASGRRSNEYGAAWLMKPEGEDLRCEHGRNAGPRALHTAACCGVTLRAFRRTPPAGFILPCQPLLVAKPPAGSGWLHEVKHDGYRIIARKEGSRVTLWSRYGTNFTDRLPKIAEAICSLAAESALIDGEAVAVRPDGHSDFAALRTKAGSARACLVAFDL